LSNNGLNLSNNGANAAASGLDSLTNYNASNTNNPQSVINAANQYVQGQNIDGQVNDAMLNATQQARDVTLPGIQQNASIGGNTDSSRNGIAQGLVQRGLAEQSANLGATLRNSAYQNGLNLAQSGFNNNNGLNLNAANAAASQGNSAANNGSSIYSGALNNTGTANSINEGNYTNSVGNAYAALQPYMSLFGSTNWGPTTNTSGTSQTQGTGTSNTESDPGMLGIMSGLLGAGVSAYKASDRRLKTDIKRVGTLDNGLPVYSYRYTGSPQFELGLMAQDVEKVKPEAVREIAGYKAVNYEMASE
jgi:hypothetical protein